MGEFVCCYFDDAILVADQVGCELACYQRMSCVASYVLLVSENCSLQA